MLTHFNDCPTKRNYNYCTCALTGEEIAIVEWQILKQEGKLKWWNFVALLSIAGAPNIEKLHT